MMDLSPIANAVKQATPPPPQAMPSVAEETKAVPDTETRQAVAPPVPGKGSEPGLGEKLDLYDNRPPVPQAPSKTEKQKRDEAQAELKKAKLLGHGTGLPMPTTDPPPQELPFLKPLGHIGRSLDATV